MPDTHLTFFILDTVDSTNNYAMAQVHAGLAKHCDGWFSGNQTQGKGQRGKAWQTVQGQNIALSVFVEPAKLNLTQPFQLSALTALACHDFFSNYASEETSIKWPNDIYWRDRKAAGILIENVFSGSNWKGAVIGMGININQTGFEEGLKNPVSLKQITGKNFETVDLARELHALLIQKMEEFNNADFDNVLDTYNQHLYKLNNIIRLKKNNVEFDTVLRGVAENGQLQTADAVERRFDFGEVEWVI